MYYHRLILLVALFSCCSLAFGQPLSEKAGAIPTQFAFTVGGDTLQITEQYLLKRGYSTGSDAGYEAFFLEFASWEPLVRFGRTRNVQSCTLILYDQDGTLLGRLNRDIRCVFNRQGEGRKPYFFNFRLSAVPFTLLDRTTRIEVTFP